MYSTNPLIAKQNASIKWLYVQIGFKRAPYPVHSLHNLEAISVHELQANSVHELQAH